MKIFVLLSVLLLSIVLCSCTNASPSKDNAKEPVNTEPLSIEFMGETITAPGSYPDVPELYTPVLDDLYLYSELLHRSEALNYEDKDTQETTLEFEVIQKKIQQRGNISYPYGGIEGASGYALVDLDGDDNPELLLLDNSSEDSMNKQTPSIYSIFTIHNEQLVCIENDSFDLQYHTDLAANGMFYQSSGEVGSPYSKLSAFRLEAGKSQFTIVWEMRAELSFSNGDVPVSYWVKKENGKEINITEDEFDTSFEQCKNPKNLMMLNFVPLHPNAVDLRFIPRPAEKPLLIEPIECPSSYPGAPSTYKSILDDLYLFSERTRLGESFEYTWENSESLGFAEPPRNEIGYALVDLNHDGTLELLLGSIDSLKNASPNSVFTLKDKKPVLLESFWSRSKGKISANGTIYSVGSGGAGCTGLTSYRLDKNSDKLTKLTDMHSCYSIPEEKAFFAQVVNGKNHYITEKEFWDFCEKYENPPKKMKLTVFSITHS